ncbi:gustatory receptor for bitter taste 22e-like [Bactrocera neohumeralis]|uniref:gustatory receptor for bitter taste 22e-like n=1 Tax=Bactrocera neohumeralis TaxID=98809 RepID=UPI002165098C|nr:gustatory receptor for bitter taste 22e-like [Bactrocera neohumeralis]
MRARLRRRFTDLILRATICSANVLAILPFRYNKTKRRVECSKLWLKYTISINVIILFLLIWTRPTKDRLNVDILQRKPIVALVNYLNFYGTIYTIVLIIWMNWRDRKNLLDFFNTCLIMEYECFRIYSELKRECEDFDNFIIWKAVLTLLQNASFVNTVYDFRSFSWVAQLLLLIFTYFLLNMLLVTIQLFIICILFQYRCFWVLNRRLQHIAEVELKQSGREHISAEISMLCGIYVRLLSIFRRCTNMYEQQALLMVAVLTGSNIMSLFFAKLIWTGKVMEMSVWSICDNLQMVLINVADFWLTITICELTVNTSRITANLLRNFNDFRRLDKYLERNVEQFSFICCDNQLKFRLCGLIDLNHETGCRILFTMILYFIYFVQVDYNAT